MATVWLAEDTSLHRKVAIKVLAERYAEDEQFVERFRREAQSAAGLNHPNIVAIYDRGVAEGTYYIAMEYLDGPTLKDVIDERGGARAEPRDRRSRRRSSRRCASPTTTASCTATSSRTTSWSRADGRLKVTDFGIARAGASQMTEVGSIVGTAQYLSPEQARGEVVGPPSDLYSVGVVLYEMLTGRVPFDGDSAVAIAMKHLSEEPVPPSVYAPGDAARRSSRSCCGALAKDAGDRYQTAEEMSADLDRARRGVALSPRTEQMTRVIAPCATARQPRASSPRATATRVWDREGCRRPGARRRPRRLRPCGPGARAGPGCCWPLLVLAAGGVAAVALGGVLGGENTPTTTTPAFVRVPSGLVGGDQFPAVDKLVALGLKAKRVQQASRQAPGMVLRVAPPGGAQGADGFDGQARRLEGAGHRDRARSSRMTVHRGDGRS